MCVAFTKSLSFRRAYRIPQRLVLPTLKQMTNWSLTNIIQDNNKLF